MTTPDLVTRFLTSTSRDDKLYIEKELLKRSVNVVVAVETTDDDDHDEVYAEVSNSSKKAASGTITLNPNDKGVLKVPLQKVWPLERELLVKVFDWDLTGDDLIGEVKWQQPYADTKEATIAARTARYRVALDIN